MASKKLLVLTALNHNLKKNSNIDFLGEWCLTYDNKKKFNNKKYFIYKHHWTSWEKLKKDSKYLEAQYEYLLKNISKLLNKIHKTKHDKEYWRILLGPWLYFYLISMFDRWESLRLAYNKKENINIPKLNFNSEVLINYDTLSFWKKVTQNDYWNQANFQRIIDFKFKNQTTYIDGLINEKKNNSFKEEKNLNTNNFNIIKKFLIIIDKLFSNFFLKFSKTYIDCTYFNKVDALKIFWACKILPAFNISTFNYETLNKDFKINKKAREIFDKRIENNKDFESYLWTCLKVDFPKVLLEDYFKIENLNFKKNKLKLKSIFSSVSTTFNERYKFWLAKMIKNGANNYVMSHGGALPLIYEYGTFEHDLKISKKYISWHNPTHTKHLKMSAIQLLKIKKENFNNNRTKCLILSCDTLRYPTKIQAWPYVEQYKSWLQDISLIIDNLNLNIKKELVYRCGATKQGFQTDRILKDKYKFLTVSHTSQESLEKSLSNSKFVVCTYPSTTVAECLIKDIPMIITMSPKLYHFEPQVKKLLREAENKIFFSDPKKASYLINKIWKNPEEWWKKKETKKIVDKIKKFSFKIEQDWPQEWSRLIN